MRTRARRQGPRTGGATAAEAGAARWLRRDSKPGDLIATNVTLRHATADVTIYEIR